MELIKRLIEVAKQEGIRRVFSVTSKENETMKVLYQKTGFSLKVDEKTGMFEASIHP
jgi:N-acetylglutamate synthase-like GNAT family acetyltransferase